MSRRRKQLSVRKEGPAVADRRRSVAEDTSAVPPPPPRRRPWFLAGIIVLEAAWIVFLAVLAASVG
jgi:hypothetical protein